LKTSYFRDERVNISKTVGDSSKLQSMTNMKLHMRFRLTPRSTILDDIELLAICSNFWRISLDFADLRDNNG